MIVYPSINHNGQFIVDDLDKANVFNNFFSQASVLDDSNAQLPDMQSITDTVLDSVRITIQDVLDQLEDLNT